MKSLRSNHNEPVCGSVDAPVRSYALGCQPSIRTWFATAMTTMETMDTRAFKHDRPRELWNG